MRRNPALLVCYVLLVLAGGALAQNPAQSFWSHTYNPSRLKIHAANVTVTGTIMDATNGKRKDGVRREADGDTHGWLKLDPGQEKYLNGGNFSDEDGNLVFEIVCYFPVMQADAKKACKDYKNPVVLPPVGSHVEMAGSWVMDDNHQHWNELHPVFSIKVTPIARLRLPEPRWVEFDYAEGGRWECPAGFHVPEVTYAGWSCQLDKETH
jgi:hypothetical protein